MISTGILFVHAPGANGRCYHAGMNRTLPFDRPEIHGHSAGPDVYTVSRLNREARVLLEAEFRMIWIEGEISNLSRPSSGHWYFSLKDESTQVRCAMFRNRNRFLKLQPEDGMHVLLRARVGLYEPRGEFQLVVEHLEGAGEGALRRAFDALKAKLETEGLFAEEYKKVLPVVPHRVGIVTSPTGAALRDVLKILKRRFPAAAVLVYPVPVQGKEARRAIATMLRLASQRRDCDVLILARGGGSIEDLWAFNEESVARAIFACEIPIVTGVGHETDVTIADFVADVRAPTPSGAAELVVPDRLEYQRTIEIRRRRLAGLVRHKMQTLSERTQWTRRRLAILHPGVGLRQKLQRVDELGTRFITATRHRLRHLQARFERTRSALHRGSPAAGLAELKRHCESIGTRLDVATRDKLVRVGGRLRLTQRALFAIDPQATLERGYSILTRTGSNEILRDASTVAVGELLDARLVSGRLRTRVEEVLTKK